MLALDGDVIIYCAPPTEENTPPMNLFQAFYVPQGTLISIRKGVWHGAQFPVSQEKVHTLIMLPERTYANDCFCYFFKEEDFIPVIK